MNLLSAILLTVVAFVCIAGVFSRSFADNWLQFLGLTGVSIWAMARLARLVEGEDVTELQLLAHAGVACFVVGTAVKVVTPAALRRLLGDRRSGQDRRRELKPTEWHDFDDRKASHGATQPRRKAFSLERKLK